MNVVHVKGGGFAVPNDLAGSAGVELGKTSWNLPKELAKLSPPSASIFFIAGLLFFAPRARQSLGAYRIPRETGLLISSVL